MIIDIPVPEPVLWHDPASLPERALRAFERHSNWIPSQNVWFSPRRTAANCCALAALCHDSAPAVAWPDSFMGGANRVAFSRGFDGHDLPTRRMQNHDYFEAGKRAWDLVKPLAEERRRELNA